MKLAELKNATKGFDVAEIRKITVEGKSEPETNRFAVYNIDANHISSIVSDRYHLVVHSQVGDSLVEALTNLKLPIEAHIRDRSDKLFIDLEFVGKELNIPTRESVKSGKHKVGETFVVGLRIINSYDKSTGVMVVPRLVRVACQNGMIVDVGSKFVKTYAIYHTNKLTEEFSLVIQRMLHELINSEPKLKELVNNCMVDSVEWSLCRTILKNLMHGREKHMQQIYNKIKPTNGKVTRWDIYNALTNYASHGKQLKPTFEDFLQDRAQQLLVRKLEKFIEVKE